MPVFAKDAGVWKEPGAAKFLAKNGGEWLPADVYAKDLGVWEQAHVKSDPITVTYNLGLATGWSRVYRGVSGVESNRTNGDDLCYWGNSWNSEIERSMISVENLAGLVSDITTRPVVTSCKLYVWVGHVYSGTQNVYVGIHGETTPPANFSRLHSEKATGYYHTVTATKPGSGAGALDTSTVSLTVAQNWADSIKAGTAKGFTFTDEGSSGAPRWGWLSGTQHSTGNTGGSASGLNDLLASDAERLRIEFTLDYA